MGKADWHARHPQGLLDLYVIATSYCYETIEPISRYHWYECGLRMRLISGTRAEGSREELKLES